MGTARSRMKKVAPVSEESSDDRRGRMLDPSVPIKEGDYNSEGQEAEFSAEDDTLAEVERILAECENADKRLNSRTFREMPALGSHGLCCANDDMYRGSKRAELHVVCVKNYEEKKPTSNIQEHISPANLLCSTNTESTATALSHGISDVSSLALPIIYDASEEDLMNTIESEFG